MSEPRAFGPASESRQGTNPRAMVRGGRRAVSYGDLAEAEGAWEQRDGFGRERYCGWEAAEAWVDGGDEGWKRVLGACVDGRSAQSAERNRHRLVTSGKCDRYCVVAIQRS